MKNKCEWPRIVIGILLLLNSLPFSGGKVIATVPGVFFIICGLLVLLWPLIVAPFCGTKSNERNFGLFDLVKVIVSACMLFFMVMIGDSEVSILCVSLLALGVIIIFIPIDLIFSIIIFYERSETMNILQYLFDNGIVSEKEYERIKARIYKKLGKSDNNCA